MPSPIFFLVILFSLVFNGLCRTSFPSKQELKIIKTKHGIYDCVDFYKQPAFSHPLLKNHTLNVSPKLIEELQGRKGGKASGGFRLKEGGCPIGTVPILRTNPNSHWGEDPPPRDPPTMPHCVAGLQTNDDPSKKFYGAGGNILVYKPSVYSNDQYSSARIKLSNGDDSLEAGWIVSPRIFNDSDAHLYVRFTNAAKGGCVNLACPGFVQVAPDSPLGKIPDKYSVVGGEQRVWNYSIAKHQDDGHWWFYEAHTETAIGYWPKDLFTTLSDVANKVEWGGETFDFGSTKPHPPPDMGSGLKVHIQRSSAIYEVAYVDVTLINVKNPEDSSLVQNCLPYYTAEDGGYVPPFERAIYFGGVIDY